MSGPEALTRPVARAARLPLLAPLAGRDFRLVWFGESVSLLGNHFHTVALSILVLGITGSGFALGAIVAAGAIPRGIFMLLGGVLSDRISPRDLALASNLVRAALTTVVAALVLGGGVQLWHLALVGILFGTVDAVFLPAINTLVPRLVAADRLAAANAMMQGTAQLVGTVGPALAGFAVALIGVGAAFAIDAVSFVVATLALWSVHSGATPGRPASPGDDGPHETAAIAPARETGPIRATAEEVATARPSLAASLTAGMRAVLGDPTMRSIVVLSTAANLAFVGPVVVGLPWLVLVRFGGDAPELGLLFAGYGAGSFAGVLLAGSLARPRRFGSVVLTLIVTMGVGLAAVGLAPGVAVAGLILVGIGAMSGYVNVVLIAWVQARSDPEMLGRTMSYLMLGSVIAAPVSLAFAAVVVDAHATAMFVAAGIVVIASGVVALASGLPRRMT